MIEPLITILVPTFNHARFINQAIDSIVGQTIFTSTKVIVSDDCSNDETVSLARAATEAFVNAQVNVNELNVGVIDHYRKLSQRVDTPYVAILEGDDYWIADDKLELQLAFLEKLPEMKMCFTRYIVEDEATGAKWLQPNWPAGRHRLLTMLDILESNPVASFSNCLYRSSSFRDALDHTDSKDGYDWLVNLKIASEAEVGYVPKAATLYRLHASGTWTTLSSERKRAGIIQTLKALERRVDLSYRHFVTAAIASLEQ